MGNTLSDNPLITVLTVCLNSVGTIERTFQSIKIQSYPNIEYIVIDGKSTDGTLDLIKKYENDFIAQGIRFKFRSEHDKGLYDAMNKGISLASGEIIGILNSNDFYENDTLSHVGKAALETPSADIFYGFLRVLLEDYTELLIYRYIYENYLLNLRLKVLSASQHPTCFVRKSVYDKIGCFDLSFPTAADYDFLIRAKKAGIKFQSLNTILSNFVLGGKSYQVDDFERAKQRFEILDKNGLILGKESRKMRRMVRYKYIKKFKLNLIKRLSGL